jgi:hypothetical protein
VKDGVNSWTNFVNPTPGWTNTYSLTSAAPVRAIGLTVYPNPVADGTLYLSEPRDIILVNQLGHRIIQKNHVNHLDVSILPPGIYFLKTEKREVIRIVII